MALDAKTKDRFSRLLNSSLDEQSKQFREKLRGLTNAAASRGMLNGGSFFSEVLEAHEQELGTRAANAWQSLRAAHESSGEAITDALADSLKSELHQAIRLLASQLNGSLQTYVARLPNFARTSGYSLDGRARHLITKTDIAIEMYVDSLMSSRERKEPAPSQINIFGSVGSLQTGANARANVVQNLGSSDTAAIMAALDLAREAIQSASEISDRQQLELLQIADECKTELTAIAPNTTKLFMMLNVVSASIQTFASAQPAYQALKSAVLPLGLTLP